MTLRVAALVKQIPAFEEMRLGPDGRLVREGLELEMNPYCRRAVAEAVLLAQDHGGSVTVLTLGPPSAEDTLREAVAWGLERGVPIDAVHVCDPAFAGSDTLATARALSAALARAGPFDLVLAGRNSIDADTGQVGPEVAELLDLPFLTGVRHLHLADRVLSARCEHDDGWIQARLALPAVVSTAERLVEPCKVDPEGRTAVPPELVRCLTADELGPGPWGQEGSPTWVGAVRIHAIERVRWRRPDLPLEEQVEVAVRTLAARGALDDPPGPLTHAPEVTPAREHPSGPRIVGVVVEPGRERVSRELLGGAAILATRVVALTFDADAGADAARLGSVGADAVVRVTGAEVEEDCARALTAWCRDQRPWAVLAPSTAWGREVAARAAAALGAGLTGDAVGLDVDEDRLVAWKPAFGGQLVAAVTATSPIQMATVRPGVLPAPAPRRHVAPVTTTTVEPRSRVQVLARTRDDDLDALAEARVVVGVGRGVPPEDYPRLAPLLETLDAELGATRKVTDVGWLPRARQIGLTGRAVAPRLYVCVAASGRFNHMVGVRAAKTVLAMNHDASAPAFDAADVGIVGDWREAVPLLVRAIDTARARASS